MRKTKFCIEWIASIYQLYFFRFWIIGSLVSVRILFSLCVYGFDTILTFCSLENGKEVFVYIKWRGGVPINYKLAYYLIIFDRDFVTHRIKPRVSQKKVYSSILGSIQKQYDAITLFLHTLLTKCLFTCVQNFKCVSCVSFELWTRENSPVKLGFVHELPMLCT